MKDSKNFLDQSVNTLINVGKKAEEAVAACPCLNSLEEKLTRRNPKAGGIFTQMRPQALWFLLFFGILALLLLLNLFIQPHHPHFGVDKYPWFWAFFGLGVGLTMIFVMKRIIQPLIVRKEDYYGDI